MIDEKASCERERVEGMQRAGRRLRKIGSQKGGIRRVLCCMRSLPEVYQK